jgi:Fungal specific transcription factor domain
MASYGEMSITLPHVQTWLLISHYEIKVVIIPRAWPSIGRAVRLAQMMQLHRLNGSNLDTSRTVDGNPVEWSESEERKRAFWMAYCLDRWASMGTGWPMILVETDVSVHPSFKGFSADILS